eukprot:4701704-Pleurochrysis_carterae.AAC.4
MAQRDIPKLDEMKHATWCDVQTKNAAATTAHSRLVPTAHALSQIPSGLHTSQAPRQSELVLQCSCMDQTHRDAADKSLNDFLHSSTLECQRDAVGPAFVTVSSALQR